MRVRTNIILEADLLAKIDLIAGDKQKRAAVIETALRQYVAREESKIPENGDIESADKKADSKVKSTKV